jgi:pimeloyl-ACP methyl ester carboxylesterase
MEQNDMTTSPQSQPRRRMIAIDSKAGAGSLAALEYGPADRPLDILFLHANGFNAMTYRHVFAPLANALRILAIDHRGHGHSRLTTDIHNHSWLTYAEDLLALLDALDAAGDRPKVLAGHSIGGTTTLLAAPRMKADFRPPIVLFDPVIIPPHILEKVAHTGRWDSPLAQGALRRNAVFESRRQALDSYRGRGAFKTWPDAMIEDYLADGLTEQDDGLLTLSCAPAWEASNFANYRHDPFQAFAAPRAPIRILRAEKDSTCSIDDRMEALLASGQVTLTVVPGTTHFLPMERPALVCDTLREAVVGMQAVDQPA